MKSEQAKIEDLVPYINNARKHSEAQIKKIAASIREYGFLAPILADENNTVLAGHGRLEAAKLLKLETVPVVRVEHLTEVQKKGYILADNRLAELAEWDTELLELELDFLKEADFDIDLTGFNLEEMEEESSETKKGNTDPDEVPEVEKNIHNVQRGQVWLLGAHRLMCGDSTNADDVGKLMNGEKADMVFTDPPYGINYDDEKWKDSRQTDHAKKNNFGKIKNDSTAYSPKHIFEYFSNAKHVFIWGAANFCQELPTGGSWIVWDKKTEAQEKCPFGDFDLCWSKGKHKWPMVRIVWGGFISKEKNEQRWHPTQKPVALAEWFFEKWGEDSQLIVDLFLGSGTTLIACEKTGRKCYGMELDEHYCSVIIERWQNFTGLKAELVK
jgi:DNA modification methylase